MRLYPCAFSLSSAFDFFSFFDRTVHEFLDSSEFENTCRKHVRISLRRQKRESTKRVLEKDRKSLLALLLIFPGFIIDSFLVLSFQMCSQHKLK